MCYPPSMCALLTAQFSHLLSPDSMVSVRQFIMIDHSTSVLPALHVWRPVPYLAYVGVTQHAVCLLTALITMCMVEKTTPHEICARSRDCSITRVASPPTYWVWVLISSSSGLLLDSMSMTSSHVCHVSHACSTTWVASPPTTAARSSGRPRYPPPPLPSPGAWRPLPPAQ